MTLRVAHRALSTFTLCLPLLLVACGGDADNGTLAQSSNVAAIASTAGKTPFLASVTLAGTALADVTDASFTVPAATGATAKPVSVQYSLAYLVAHGAFNADHSTLQLPVFGLYAGQSNDVGIALNFRDGSTQQLTRPIAAAAYVDPSGVYDKATIVQPRDATRALGFSYMYLKSGFGSPVVIDVDGKIRWAATGIASSLSSIYTDDGFIIGDQKSGAVYRQELDGSVTTLTAQSTDVAVFGHNFDPGKTGIFTEPDWVDSLGKTILESTIDELTPAGVTTRRIDLAALISAYMTAQGDDPTLFVRPGFDWMHTNATLYDASDDSVIVSSRENFVMKIGYTTGDIRWILGDPTKYWHQFASLRAKALTLPSGDLYPVGQHAVTFTPDGQLMLFNDGLASRNQPTGAPAGENRTYSAVSVYAIDTPTMTAHETWRYDHDQTILSPICSSAYGPGDGSLLVDYSSAENFTHMRLVGLDPSHKIAFEYLYDSPTPCQSGWNALPIAFDHLQVG